MKIYNKVETVEITHNLTGYTTFHTVDVMGIDTLAQKTL